MEGLYFKILNNTTNWVKKYLSKSFIQKCQIYNLFRDAVYQYFKGRIVIKAKSTFQEENIYNVKISLDQMFYNNLL